MCSNCGLNDLHNHNQLIKTMESSYKKLKRIFFRITGARVLTSSVNVAPKTKKVTFYSLLSTLIFHIENTTKENNLVTDLSHYDELHLCYSKSVGIVQSLLSNQNTMHVPLNQLPIINIKRDRKRPKKTKETFMERMIRKRLGFG